MAIGTAIAVAGLGLAAYGTYQQYQSQQKQSQFQAQALEEQRRNEAERRKAMELDAARRKRELIRRSVAARSQSLAVTTAQNASQGSGLQGAYGGISGRTEVDTLGVNQNLQIGRNIFAGNANVSSLYQSAAMAGGDAAMYGGMRSLGGALVSSQGTVNKIGEFVGKNFNFGTGYTASTGSPGAFDY